MEEGWVGFIRGMGFRVFYSVCFFVLGYFVFEIVRFVILDCYVK